MVPLSLSATLFPACLWALSRYLLAYILGVFKGWAARSLPQTPALAHSLATCYTLFRSLLGGVLIYRTISRHLLRGRLPIPGPIPQLGNFYFALRLFQGYLQAVYGLSPAIFWAISRGLPANFSLRPAGLTLPITPFRSTLPYFLYAC